jgi:subtilisin-like proprotein convertase family protein
MFRLLLPAISACAIVLLCAASSQAADAVPTLLPAPPGSEAEPNGTAATASPIQAGERIRATIYPAGDVDRYRFHAEAGDRVYAMTMTDGTASDDDTVMTLFGGDGTTAIESDDHDGSQSLGASSLAGTAVPASGTYYVEVKGRRGNEWIRPYDLWLDVRSGTPATEAEPNDALATANPLSGVVAGTTDPANDPDYYALALGAGDSVFLSLDLDPDRDGATQNAALGFGPSLDQLTTVTITRSVDAGHSMGYTATVPTAGTYYVYVGGRGGAETSYQLSATVIPAAKPSCRTYPVTPANGAIPDLGTATFPIDVPDAATVGHVALVTDLTHSYPTDIIATLESPSGLDVPVFGETGRNTDHMAVTWDDNAASAVVTATLPASTVLQSTQRGGLRSFDGQQASGTWKLRLIDNGADDIGSLDHAALVICARPELGPAETVFSAGFEDGDDGFTHTGTADEWERGTPATAPRGNQVAGLSACAEGSQCFKTDLDGTYEANSSQDLVSPPISLAGRTGPLFVSWAMWHQLENADFDHATVTVEEDGGANPRNLFTWLGPNPYVSRNLLEMKYGTGWNVQRADISAYAGKTIRLRFHLDSDRDTNLAGLAIDDVRVVELKPAPAQQAPESSPPPATTTTTTPATAVPATAEERALSRLKLAKSCVRPSRSGKSRITMTLGLAKPRPVQVRVERAVGSTGRGTCWKPNAGSPTAPLSTRWRPVTLMGAATASSVTRRMSFNVRLKPGLYRLTVQLVLENGKLSSPVRRYVRVVAK